MFLDDVFKNALDVLDDASELEFDKDKIAKLIADGVEIAVIADAAGVAEEVIRAAVEGE